MVDDVRSDVAALRGNTAEMVRSLSDTQELSVSLLGQANSLRVQKCVLQLVFSTMSLH